MITKNHECYVSLEVAKLLKQAGFDWETREYYKPIKEGYKLDWNSLPVNWNQKVAILIAQKHNRPEGYSAPTLDVVQRWLREVKGIEFDFCWHMNLYNQYKYSYAIKVKSIRKCLDKGKEIEVTSMDCLDAETCLDTYEAAQEAGIKKALEIILEKGE